MPGAPLPWQVTLCRSPPVQFSLSQVTVPLWPAPQVDAATTAVGVRLSVVAFEYTVLHLGP